MSRRPSPCALLAAIAVAVAAGAASAQQVASLAAVRGEVEVLRGKGDWQPAFAGHPVVDGDRLRTNASGGVTLVFNDDCVVILGPGTALTVDRYGGKAPRRALLRLENGAMQAIVSGYSGEGARFEVETASAVVRVQGTQFVVRFDPITKATDVAGLEGTVAVQGRTAVIGPGVAVGRDETSRVEIGKFPSPVREMSAAERTQMLAGLGLFGTGGRDGLDTDNPLLEGSVVAESDHPQLSAAATATGGTYLKPPVPDEPLMWRLSPDVRANTQPLPVYEAYPPNVVPPQ
ncbi:FecR domain-containing protein [bacterium]|nr:FecR domain-containing protein [bacterium]